MPDPIFRRSALEHLSSPDRQDETIEVKNARAWLALAAYPDPAPFGSLLGLASAAKTLTFWTSGAVLLAALGMLVIARARQLRSRANGSDVDATARH